MAIKMSYMAHGKEARAQHFLQRPPLAGSPLTQLSLVIIVLHLTVILFSRGIH
jgi:hypothetical protein